MPEATPVAPAPTEAPAAPVVDPKVEAPKPPGETAPEPKAAEPAKKDPKALAAEQERRLEARATALRADLTKRERELTTARAEMSKREAALKELSALKEAKEGAKDDPISFLEAFGLTFEEVAKAATEGRGADPAARKALKEARELRAKLEEREKSDGEAQKKAAAAQQAETRAKTINTIDSMLKSDKKYRYAAEFGTPDDVFDAWFQAYQRTGKMPNVETVALKVNEYYRGQAELAHKAWAEELTAQEAAKKPAPAAEKKVEPAVEKKVDKKVDSTERVDAGLRGRTHGQGARSYQGEIQKQLEEARKSRAS